MYQVKIYHENKKNDEYISNDFDDIYYKNDQYQNNYYHDNESHENQEKSRNEQNFDINIEHVEDACFEINQNLISKCSICRAQFYFNNKLHRHLRKGCLATKIKAKVHAITIDSSISIVHFEQKHDKMNDLIFRSRQYAKIKISINFIAVMFDELCIDNDTFMIFADKRFVIDKCFDINIQKIITAIKIRGIRTIIHDNFEYVVMNIYFLETIKRVQILTHLKIEIHLMSDLKINVLLKIDVLILEEVILNFERNIMIISICKEFVIKIIIMRKIEKIIKSIKAFEKIIISANVVMTISIHIKKATISNDIYYSFLFKTQFTLDSKDDFFAHVIEFKLIAIQMKNAFNTSYVISKNVKINKLHDYDEEKYYMTRSKYRHLAIASQSVDIKESLSAKSFSKKKTFCEMKSQFMMIRQRVEK